MILKVLGYSISGCILLGLPFECDLNREIFSDVSSQCHDLPYHYGCVSWKLIQLSFFLRVPIAFFAMLFPQHIDRIQKRPHGLIYNELFFTQQPLSGRRNLASLSLFYHGFHGKCSSEIHSLVPSLFGLVMSHT